MKFKAYAYDTKFSQDEVFQVKLNKKFQNVIIFYYSLGQ